MEKIYGDRMHREQAIEDIVSVIKACIDTRNTTTFSIEGNWGQGKSWLIEKLEACLKGIDLSKSYTQDEFSKTKSDYFIIHYNAWEKDYYDEPLLAILLTIVNELNRQLVVYNTLNALGTEIGKQALILLESALGAISERLLHFNIIDLGKSTISKAKKLKEKGEIKLQTKNDLANIESDILNVVQVLNSISKECPIIFVVDELDRCLPNNAIKTLERLHHIFGKVNNSVTVISVCRKQLNESINQMFGLKINADEYLKKFIDFNLELDNGLADVTEVNRLLEEYSLLFSAKTEKTVGTDILVDLCDYLLPREYECVCRNALLCHKLANEDTTSFPYECMVAEIIAQAYPLASTKEENKYNISPDNGNTPKTVLGTALKKYLGNLRDITFLRETNRQSIIAYILKIILNFKYKITYVESETEKLFAKKLDEYYKKYLTYFRMIK